jgi:protein involved in sex pheromone biosynthesis
MRFTQPVYVEVPDSWTFDAKVTDAGKYQVTSRGIELCIEELPVGLALYDSERDDSVNAAEKTLMTTTPKDTDHLRGLAEMAAKGHVITSADVDNTKTREQELFEAYQRGKRDGFIQAKYAIQSLFQEGE